MIYLPLVDKDTKDCGRHKANSSHFQTEGFKGEPFQVLSEAFRKDKQKRDKLCSLYKETKGFLDQLNEDTTLKVLGESVKDFKATLDNNIERIKPKDQYIILVVGETSAGNSSIINLILGEDLLSSKVLHCTSTICELKYGKKPAILAHFENEEKNPPTLWELGDPSSFKEKIAEFASSKTQDGRERAPYKKVEVFWPHQLLKEGVMIVDSPGVGESQAMDQCVHDYLANAFCFMYVIKSTNAGGVKKDRLLSLLQKVKAHKVNESMDHRLFTKSALFVANFWDEIPSKEAEDVKNSQLEALTRKMGELDESQIVYMSCKRVQLAQSYGLIADEFDKLMNGIIRLLESYLNDSLQIYYKWLGDFLFRTSEQVGILLNSTTLSNNEREERMQKVMDRMAGLEKSQDQLFNELSESQLQAIKEVINDLANYFKSEDTTRRFCAWSSSDLPEDKATWEETKSEALKCISERARAFVQKWEEDEHHFARTQVALIKHCAAKYDIMEVDIRNLQEEVGRPEQENLSFDPFKRYASLRRRLPVQGNAPVWFRQGLTSVVLGTPFIYNLAEKLKKNFKNKRKLEKFKLDLVSYMKKKSQKCLGLIANEESLLPFINDQLKDAVQFLKNIKAKISRLREGDKQIYSQLYEANVRSTFEIKEVYEPVRSRLEVLKREVTVYEVNFLRTSKFSNKELQWNQDDKSIVGRGTFSTVYSGALLRKGQPEVEVALKVYNNPIRSNNISHFIEEEYALRCLSHPNIIKFFGTHLFQSPPSWTKVIIVLELCKCSLKTRIMSQPENAPALSKDETARMNVLLWAEQILDALNYFHQQGYVHRDLNLDNLLLTDDNKVKLIEVGIAKHEKEMTGTFRSMLTYLAPEVLAGKTYNTEADMYSFGVILWEMWYAETAFQPDVIPHSPFQLTKDKVTEIKALRPRHIKGTYKPWSKWELVMKTCWEGEPSQRLTALECLQELGDLRQRIEKKAPSGLAVKHVPLPEATQSQSTAESSPITLNPDPITKPKQQRTPPPIKPKPERSSMTIEKATKIQSTAESSPTTLKPEVIPDSSFYSTKDTVTGNKALPPRHKEVTY
ncbi:uncharacterized protein LOC111334739 isoform X2 [Stylophora pistillata]|uniref:uncharacterized protein LOC111334739 isoform X2 n=1 Tax=Stylophora pistillata TaxID=50429 RepID=UPI000C044522|nr:uncharacterized protein LOC111334739 isoform X2 [Stylophora pistillata]